MIPKVTPAEKKLLTHAKKAIVKYNKMRQAKGGIDTLYAFVLSDSGQIHDGACLETNVGHANICGERHAIANMILKESYEANIKSILVANVVPEVQANSTTPCGTCRQLIWEFGRPGTTVLCLQYIRIKDHWVFPKLQKHIIKKLLTKAYEPVKWE